MYNTFNIYIYNGAICYITLITLDEMVFILDRQTSFEYMFNILTC